MNQNISELTKALRDAAASIERAAKFSLGEDVNIAEAVALVASLKAKNCHAIITIEIELPYSDSSEDVKVEFKITESYKEVAKSESFKSCLEAYAASKQSSDSMASVAKMLKKIESVPVAGTDNAG